jgi:DNA-binding transcriptional ArsR family regulator
MVEQAYNLDAVFGSLSDPTRRDIIRRISRHSMSVGSIAKNYRFSFAGVAKHLEVLERAGLINKTKQGKEQIVSLQPEALETANKYLVDFEELWHERLDSLDDYLNSTTSKGNSNDQYFS